MSYQYISDEGLQDLDNIWDYVASDSVDAADRIVDEIYEAVVKLASMPNMGHLRENLTDKPLRFWRVRSYLIIYRTDVEPIEVVRIVSGYRDIKRLLG